MHDASAENVSGSQDKAEPVAKVLSWTNGSYSRNYKLEWLGDVPEGAYLYAAPPTPLLREAMEALESCSTGGYTDIDGDFRKTWFFNESKIDAVLAKLRETLGEQGC